MTLGADDHEGANAQWYLATAGRVFRNVGKGGRWLEVRLIGDGVKTCRDAIGALAQRMLLDVQRAQLGVAQRPGCRLGLQRLAVRLRTGG